MIEVMRRNVSCTRPQVLGRNATVMEGGSSNVDLRQEKKDQDRFYLRCSGRSIESNAKDVEKKANSILLQAERKQCGRRKPRRHGSGFSGRLIILTGRDLLQPHPLCAARLIIVRACGANRSSASLPASTKPALIIPHLPPSPLLPTSSL